MKAGNNNLARTTIPLLIGFLLTVCVNKAEAQGDNWWVNQPQNTPVIKVTTILTKPYAFTEDKSFKSTAIPEYKGYAIELLEHLKKITGIKNVHLKVLVDGQYGYLNETDGRWYGMVGDLIDKETDMVVAPLTQTEERSRVLDFSHPFQTFGRVALVKQWPKPEDQSKRSSALSLELKVRLGRLFAPLEDSVWLLSGLAWFVSSLVLYLICRINPYEWRRMAREREATLREGESFSCMNSYWFMLGAVFWQGFMRSPRSVGARIVVTFWWLYALIFVSMYIASLTNFLQSLPNPPTPTQQGAHSTLQTFQDIIDDPSVVVGAIKNGATSRFFETSKDDVHKKIWTRMSRDMAFEQDLEAGIARVRKSTPDRQYVFLAESTMAEYFIRQAPCDVYTIREFPIFGSYALAFGINSQFKSVMNFALLQLKENGILWDLEKKWFSGECKGKLVIEPPKTSNVLKIQYPPFQKVDLASFSGALILLIIGLFAGSIVTGFELFIYKYTEDVHEDGEHEKEPFRDESDSSKPHPNHRSPNKSSETTTDV